MTYYVYTIKYQVQNKAIEDSKLPCMKSTETICRHMHDLVFHVYPIL